MSKKIRVAVVGVGNCASSLIQGVDYYRKNAVDNLCGIAFKDVGGYSPTDIEFTLAYDVDQRKVGLPLGQAILAGPNCARVFHTDITDNPVVKMGRVLDGISDHMKDYHSDINFKVDHTMTQATKSSVIDDLITNNVDVMLNYLPVGSQEATEFYMECALAAKVAVVNCIPIFIASDPVWEKKFRMAGIPIIGDDMRSQFGASVVSQILQELAYDRGCRVKFHQQINIGGNTDFANMMNPERIKSKKTSKENVIRSQNDLRNIPVEKDSLYAGPSNFLPYLKDNKVAYFRLELEGFGGAPISFDAKLSVQDSENSAGVVIDAIRFLKVAQEMGITGALRGPSAFTQKTPPQQMMFKEANYECEMLAKRKYTEVTKKQVKKYND